MSRQGLRAATETRVQEADDSRVTTLGAEPSEKTMNDQIKHDGSIVNIEGEHIQVRIAQTSACLHCKIANHCNSAESKEKVIDVWTKNAQAYAVGQNVSVVMGGKKGLKAVLIAFVVPLVLAFAVIMAALQLTSEGGIHPVNPPYNQGIAAVAGMLTFAIYYTALYFMRDSLEGDFKFRIES